MIDMVMSQSWENKCEVAGQGSFTLPNACRFSMLLMCARELWLRELSKATATLTS